MARRLLNFLNGLLNLVTMIVIVVVGVYAGYALWDNQQIYSAAENVQADMLLYKQKADKENNHADMLRELKLINPDVRAWLTLDNTKVDYPVVQGYSNYVYLNMDVYGNYSLAGSIFEDSRNDPNFCDPYILIHGHHMAERQMFGDLDLYKDKKFFDENRTGNLYLEDRTYNLRTLACMVVDSKDVYIYNPRTWLEDMEELLKYVEKSAMHWDEEQLQRLLLENEAAKSGGRMPQILSLATCSGEYESARTIVLAEMIPSELAENGEEEP